MSAHLDWTNSSIHDGWRSAETITTDPEEWCVPERMDDTSLLLTAGPRSAPRGETETVRPANFRPAVRRFSTSDPAGGTRFTMIQQWECIVTAVLDDHIGFEMYDLTDSSNAVEYAEIAVEEFSEYDRPLLAEGVVFYWSLGTTRKPNGQILKSSELRVRRMPRLSSSQRKEIEHKVSRLSEIIQQ
jgi:hypothetical protein